MAGKHVKRSLPTAVIGEMQIKTMMKHWSYSLKEKRNTEHTEEVHPWYTVGISNVLLLQKNTARVPQKVKHRIIIEPRNSTFSINKRKAEAQTYIHTHPHIHITSSSIQNNQAIEIVQASTM